MGLESLIDTGPAGRSRPLLIDDTDYSVAVIRQGADIPWTDTASAIAHFGQVRGLLNPDALWVDVARLYTSYLDTRPELLDAMGSRSRTGYPLRTLLGDEQMLSATVEVLGTIAGSAHRPLILRLPSPAVWLAKAHAAVGNPLDSVDADGADSASMYIAEWLGRLGALPVALVLLDARGGQLAEDLADYRAIANVLAHFGWSLGIWAADGIRTAGDGPAIGVLDAQFWISGAEVPDAEVLVTTIPSTASPERVLDQLLQLN